MIRHQLCDVHPLSSHQGSFLCCQTLRSARHQTYGGGQTREQETHEEGPGDSGAQSAPEAPTPPHSQPDRHVRNPQQLRPRPGDVSTDRNRVKCNGIKLISFCLTLRFFPSDVLLFVFQGWPRSSAGLHHQLGESDRGESGLLPSGRFRSFTVLAQLQDSTFGRKSKEHNVVFNTVLHKMLLLYLCDRHTRSFFTIEFFTN